ncbi:MAG TPA: putative Ig domain-containing protein, partial [Blastocatellia bacterium]|nr:putative Ig domain-containing protein [Blastocatellia bacterium]
TTRANNGVTTIDTIAGGYGEGLEVNRAAFTSPVAVARDPLGRGLYVFDQTSREGLLRFINTGSASVTLAGKTIAPGTSRSLVDLPDSNGVQTIPTTTITSLTVSTDGNLVFFTDSSASIIFASGSHSVYAFNVSASAQTFLGNSVPPSQVIGIANFLGLNATGLAVHPQTGQVYVAAANRIYKLTTISQADVVVGNDWVSLQGDPFPSSPQSPLQVPLLTPRDLAFDSAGNLFIADTGHARIVKLDTAGQVSLILQFPLSPNSPLGQNPFPSGLAIRNDKLYVANGNRQAIFQITGAGSSATVPAAGTLGVSCDYSFDNCGDGGAAAAAKFLLPGQASSPAIIGLESDANGLFVLDQRDKRRGRIRYLNFSAQPVTLAGTTVAPNTVATIAGNGATEPFDGPATGTELSDLSGVSADANGNLWLADTYRHTIRFVNRGQSAITLFAGTAAEMTVPAGHIATINRNVPTTAVDNTPANRGAFNAPQGVFVTAQGVFISDSRGGLPTTNLNPQLTGLVRFINTSQTTVTFYPGSASPINVPPGFVRTIAGGGRNASANGDGGFALAARFYDPSDIVVQPITGDLYLAETAEQKVRKINANTGVVSSLTLGASQYTGLGVDANGRLYLADAGVRFPSYSGNFSNGSVLRETSAGSGVFAQMNNTSIVNPRDVAVDTAGRAYVTQSARASSNQERRILRIAPDGTVSVLAGSTLGFDGDGGPATAARLMLDSYEVFPVNTSFPAKPSLVTANVIVGNNNDILFADIKNRRIRRIGEGVVTCVKTGTITITGNNPAPTLSQLSPNEAFSGRSVTLTVGGTGFTPNSQIRWNGSPRPTTYVSGTQLTAAIPAGDTATAGAATITVSNPAPGGGTSNSLSLQINQVILPVIGELIPSTVNRGSAGVRLQVLGGNFLPASVVFLNGQPRPTTFINSEKLEADIPAGDLTRGGSVNITVLRQPGGDQSGIFALGITCPGLTINTQGLAVATLGTPYSGMLTASGGAAPYFFEGVSVPAGLRVSESGLVSGTPNRAGNFDFKVSVRDGNNCSTTILFMLTVNCQALTIIPSALGIASVSVFYSVRLSTMETRNVSFMLVAGALPASLTLAANGTLSGIPSTFGSFTFRVRAVSDNLCIGEREYTLEVSMVVRDCLPNSGVPISLPVAIVGQRYDSGAIQRSNGITCGELPPGLQLFFLDNGPGSIMGTPTLAGIYTFAIEGRLYTITVTNCLIIINVSPGSLPDALSGHPYLSSIKASGGKAPYSFSIVSGTLPAGLTLNSTSSDTAGITGQPTITGSYKFTIKATDANGCIAGKSYAVTVHSLAAKIGDPVTCLGSGGTVAVEATVTNAATSSQPATFTATPDQNLFAIANTCTATVGTCAVDTATNKVNWLGTLAAGQTVTIRYKAQVADALPSGTQVCVTSVAQVGNSVPGSVTACATLNCPAAGPGALAQTRWPLSDGKPGSVLVYNVYTSSSNPNQQNTRLNLTNTNPALPANVHLFFVDGASCSVADSFICLTPNQTTSFLASDFDPGTSGYVVAVAVDNSGCPLNFNYLVGDEFVKFASGHAANLSAQAVAAIAGGLPACDANASTATLNFDGVSYGVLPHVLATDNLPSRADGNDTLLILNRIGGNLGL